MNRRSFFGAIAGLIATTMCRRKKPSRVAHVGMHTPSVMADFDVPYTVITNNADDDAAAIFSSGVLPKRFAQYSTDNLSTVRRIALRQDAGNDNIWHAIATYSSASLN